MALSGYALASLAETKRHLNYDGDEKNSLVEDIINAVTDIVEQYLSRHIVTRGAVTEYHTPEAAAVELRTQDWPIVVVTSVHEDTVWPRTHGASYLLVEDTDFQVVKPDGILRRIGTSGLKAWSVGSRAIKVVYSYGYANTAAVPARIKRPALDLCALMYVESTNQRFGESGASDTVGNWTRWSAATLTPDMIRALDQERRWRSFETAERVA